MSDHIPEIKFVPPLTQEERAAVREIDDPAVRRALAAYDGLLSRLRLAEMVMWRSKCLADDMAAITQRESSRGRKQSPEGLVNMAKVYVIDYVVPLIDAVREGLGYREGAAQEGWYIEPEDVRAKIVGARRARERLEREGRR